MYVSFWINVSQLPTFHSDYHTLSSVIQNKPIKENFSRFQLTEPTTLLGQY